MILKRFSNEVRQNKVRYSLPATASLQIANHTSKQTIRQSGNQNYGQFHAVKRGSRYWYFTWFSGQVLFADRHGRIDFIPPTCGLKNGLSIISVVIQHRLYVGFEMVHVLLSCEKGAISSEIDLFEECVRQVIGWSCHAIHSVIA